MPLLLLLFDDVIQFQSMNTSNAFSDYMVTYSVNRSINLSPTSGRLHKQKQRGSYGPTICLLNRSREKIEESTNVDGRQEGLLEKILMISIENQRLNQALKEARNQTEERMVRSKIRETSFLKEQNQKLRVSLVRLETLQIDHQKRIQSDIFDLKEKLTLSQSQNRTLNRKLRDYEEQVIQLQRKGKANESIAERAKLEASRMQMSMHFNSTNIDLHKSMAREKAIEVQSLRERVARCEDIINDQKFLIAGQKEEISKEKMKFFQLQSNHLTELQYLRKQLEFTQRQLIIRGEQQAKKWQAQVKQWRNRTLSTEEELRQKCAIIANQVKTIAQQEQNITELSRQINDLQFNCHSQVIRAEESVKLVSKQRERQTKKQVKQLQKYTQEIQQLKMAIEQYKLALAQKNYEAEQSQVQATLKLKLKDKQIKRITKRHKEQKEETQVKLNKSLSVDNSIVSHRLRASQVNLQTIFNSVLDLKTSNQRTSKLITRSIAPVKDIYYAK